MIIGIIVGVMTIAVMIGIIKNVKNQMPTKINNATLVNTNSGYSNQDQVVTNPTDAINKTKPDNLQPPQTNIQLPYDIIGSPRGTSMALYIFSAMGFVAYIVITVVIAISTIAQFSFAGLCIVAFMIGLAIFYGVLLCRYPFKTILHANHLITHTLRGAHGVDLSEIVALNQVIMLPSRALSIQYLKLTDASGRSITITLGSLPKSERDLFYEPLLQTLQNSQIHGKKLSDYTTWSTWYTYRNG